MKKVLITLQVAIVFLYISCQKESIESDSSVSQENLQELSDNYALEGVETIRNDEKSYDLGSLTSATLGEVKAILDGKGFQNLIGSSNTLYISQKMLSHDELIALDNLEQADQSITVAAKMKTVKFSYKVGLYDGVVPGGKPMFWRQGTKTERLTGLVFDKTALKVNLPSNSQNRASSFWMQIKNAGKTRIADVTLKIFDRRNRQGRLTLNGASVSNLDPGKTKTVLQPFTSIANNQAESIDLVFSAL